MKIDSAYQIEAAAANGKKQEERPILQSVFISDYHGQSVAVASSGMILAVVPITLDDGDEYGMVPLDHFAAARKLAGRQELFLALGDKQTMTRDGTTRVRTVEGTFPDWQRIVNSACDDYMATTETHPYVVSINTTFLSRLTKALGGSGVVLRAMDPKKVILAKPVSGLHEKDPSWFSPPFGLIMPMYLAEGTLSVYETRTRLHLLAPEKPAQIAAD